MSEPCRCYSRAVPTLHPPPQVQEGLRGVGRHTLDPQALLLMFPQGLGASDGECWEEPRLSSPARRRKPRAGSLKLLLLLNLTVSTVGCFERFLYRCQAPCKVPLMHCHSRRTYLNPPSWCHLYFTAEKTEAQRG